MKIRLAGFKLKRSLAVLGLTIALVGAVPGAAHAGGDTSMYSGFGAWIELWDGKSFENPEWAVDVLASKGVRTIYLQSGNSATPKAGEGDLLRPTQTARFLKAAHARKMKVVAWYLPYLEDVDFDFKRISAALDFRTADGEAYDSFALDVESDRVKPAAARTERLLDLLRRIRSHVGVNYPVGAIIPAPRGMELAGDYWPNFPYREVRELTDVFLPMGYHTYRTKPAGARAATYTGEDGVHLYTMENVERVRTATGDPNVPIHYISGVADKVEPAEMKGFVRGAVDSKIEGASLYNFRCTTESSWEILDSLQNYRRDWFLPKVELAAGVAKATASSSGGAVTDKW